MTEHILNVFSQQVDNGGPASVPGIGEKSYVAVWVEAIFLTKKSGSRLATRTEFCDVFPAWQALCALGFVDQKVRCSGLAQVQQRLRAKMHWEDIVPESQKKGQALLGGGRARVEASKHFEKTEKPIVLFLSLELHLMYWPHIVL